VVRRPEATLATLFSLAAARWGIPKRETVTGYLWSWLENQVLCAVKLVPLGQVAGQRLLRDLAVGLPARVRKPCSDRRGDRRQRVRVRAGEQPARDAVLAIISFLTGGRDA